MYIQYNMNQTSLPLELSTCIDPNHIVFSIYDFVDSLDENYFEIFETQDGRPAYHPKPLIMSLLYAYSKGGQWSKDRRDDGRKSTNAMVSCSTGD